VVEGGGPSKKKQGKRKNRRQCWLQRKGKKCVLQIKKRGSKKKFVEMLATKSGLLLCEKGKCFRKEGGKKKKPSNGQGAATPPQVGERARVGNEKKKKRR